MSAGRSRWRAPGDRPAAAARRRPGPARTPGSPAGPGWTRSGPRLADRLLQEELQVLEGAQRPLDALAQLLGVGSAVAPRADPRTALIQEAADPLHRLPQRPLPLLLPGRPPGLRAPAAAPLRRSGRAAPSGVRPRAIVPSWPEAPVGLRRPSERPLPCPRRRPRAPLLPASRPPADTSENESDDASTTATTITMSDPHLHDLLVWRSTPPSGGRFAPRRTDVRIRRIPAATALPARCPAALSSAAMDRLDALSRLLAESSDPDNPPRGGLASSSDRLRAIAVVGLSRDPDQGRASGSLVPGGQGIRRDPGEPPRRPDPGQDGPRDRSPTSTEPVDMVLVFRPSEEAGACRPGGRHAARSSPPSGSRRASAPTPKSPRPAPTDVWWSRTSAPTRCTAPCTAEPGLRARYGPRRPSACASAPRHQRLGMPCRLHLPPDFRPPSLSSSMRKVLRSMPMYVRPYMLFSFHTP